MKLQIKEEGNKIILEYNLSDEQIAKMTEEVGEFSSDDLDDIRSEFISRLEGHLEDYLDNLVNSTAEDHE